MTGFRPAVFCGALLFVLTACGGGSHGSAIPAATGSATTPQSVTVKIDVPKSTGASNTRHPQYISPATTQISVNMQSGCPGACASISGYPKTVALTPTSAGCTSTLATTECQLSIALAPGSYVGTFTTLDAGGATLSTATSVPVIVIAGAVNSVSVSLSGVPASLHTTVATTGGTTTSLMVFALDADGNFIIGPGAPSFTISQSGGPVVLGQPTATTPNTFEVTPRSVGTTQLTLNASYGSAVTNACDGTIGGVCTATASISSSAGSESIFTVGECCTYSSGDVIEYSTSGSVIADADTPTGASGGIAVGPSGNVYAGETGAIAVYAPPDNGEPTSSFPATGQPTALAFDSHGDVFIADTSNPQGNNEVIELAPPYTNAPIRTIRGFDAPLGLALDASDDLFVSDNAGSVREFAPPYTGAAIATITAGLTNPISVAVAPSGNLFVSDFANGINEYAPPFNGASPIATAATNGGSINGLAIDAQGNLYASSQDYNEIFEINAPYNYGISGWNTVVDSASTPLGLAIREAFTVTVGS
jgi:hypothetical protein